MPLVGIYSVYIWKTVAQYCRFWAVLCHSYISRLYGVRGTPHRLQAVKLPTRLYAEGLPLNYFSLFTCPNDFSILVEFNKKVFGKSQFSICSNEYEIIVTHLNLGPDSNFKVS